MDALLAHLLDAAGRAPSAHNTQPWRLRPFAGGLELRLSPERMLPAADASGNDALHALGAMLENLVVTLGHLGYAWEYMMATAPAEGAAILTLRWIKSHAPRPDPTLYRMIPVRRTSRLPYRAEMPAEEVLRDLRERAAPCRLRVLTDAGQVLRVRRLVAEATAIQLADARISKELYAWLRFSPRHPGWHRDGLNAACMGWKGWEAAVAKRLLAPRLIAALARLGLHRALVADLNAQAPPAPVLCLLTLSGEGIRARIEAGRCLQRVWLAAAGRGMVTHPLSAAVDVEATRPRVLEIFGLGTGEGPVNLFRLGFSAPPARSPRLPADEILEPAAGGLIAPVSGR